MSTQTNDANDIDPIETQEWLDALSSVLESEGTERAHFLLENLVKYTRRRGVHLPFDATTAYLNTIPVGKEQKSPGNQELEHRIRSIIRWNAAAMVLRAGKKDLELGGHIASFQSAATLYDVGFNHFWHAKHDDAEGDLVFIQGHSAPGIYARAFVEGRLSEDELNNFRQEVEGKGLSSYPHPHLMPDFWQFPTVSMGLGPLMAIYQARFLKYLESRGLTKTKGRKVWVFCGDGEMDEPESQGAISLAAREGLDNLIFVINCNLQRLDGPVRGNGKIIQELEGNFRGAGWNVLKVIWGSRWDALLARDTDNELKARMDECLDGDYQTYKSKDGAYVRDHFFNTPSLKAMVANMSDAEIWALNRGGHDPHKVYAAYYEAVNNPGGRPTVILAKTIKGYGMGASGEGLQHEDGHSQIQADLIPNCISYDPTFSYEVAVIVHDGLRRMYVEQEDVYYYLTVMNENYTHPAMPQRKGIEEEILKGMYLLKAGEKGDKKVQLMGSGVILNEVIKGAELLKNDFGVDADIWSVPSFNLLHRDAIEVERYNRLHPLEEAKLPFVTRQLQGYEGPVIASTDYIRSFADRIRAYIPNNYHVLGTDGFGRSDSRANLRDFFEVDSRHVAVAALSALAEQGKVGKEVVQQAIEKYGIQTDTAPSWKR